MKYLYIHVYVCMYVYIAFYCNIVFCYSFKQQNYNPIKCLNVLKCK